MKRSYLLKRCGHYPVEKSTSTASALPETSMLVSTTNTTSGCLRVSRAISAKSPAKTQLRDRSSRVPKILYDWGITAHCLGQRWINRLRNQEWGSIIKVQSRTREKLPRSAQAPFFETWTFNDSFILCNSYPHESGRVASNLLQIMRGSLLVVEVASLIERTYDFLFLLQLSLFLLFNWHFLLLIFLDLHFFWLNFHLTFVNLAFFLLG